MLNLIPADVGRPITQLRPNIECPDLGELIAEVIDSVATVEREVVDHEGRWYSLRIRPYKGLENRIEGAVLALVEIDVVKRHELEIGRARAHAEAIVQAVRHPLVVLDGALRVRTANPAFERAFRVTTGEARGRSILQLDDGRWDVPQLRQGLERLLPEDDETQEVEADFRVDGVGAVWFYARRLDADDDGEPLILLGLAPRSST